MNNEKNSRQKAEHKGFILTLDVLMAVLVLVIFTTALSFGLYQQQHISWLPKVSHDYLTVLDKSSLLPDLAGMTESAAETLLGSYINMLPVNVGGKMIVEIYEPKLGDFNLKMNISATKGSMKEEKIKTKRIFVNVEEDRYCIATLEAWYE